MGIFTFPGLYYKVREASEQEKAFWHDNPLHMNEMLLEEMGVSQLTGEVEYPPLERIWARPTLEVHGISGGFVGEGAKTVIPAIAKAKISLRLPADLKSDEVFVLLERRVMELAPAGVEVTVRKVHGGEAVMVPIDTLAYTGCCISVKGGIRKRACLYSRGWIDSHSSALS